MNLSCFGSTMQSSLFSFIGLIWLLATLTCSEAAPSSGKEAKVEQLVRVYPISEDQYEKLLKLTNGKHLISEARLTSAGFTSVRNSLDSGWHSLLRIMGLTTTSRADVAKIDIDGQPLCVMKRSLSEDASAVVPMQSEPRSATEDEESVINCIVVLKKDQTTGAASSAGGNPSFAPYWYQDSAAPTQVVPPQQPLPVEPQVVPPAQPLAEIEPEPVAVTTVTPKMKKTKSKSKSKTKAKQTKVDSSSSRQYPSPYGLPPPPPSPYGSPYGASYPYAGYGGAYPGYGGAGGGYGYAPNPYQSYNPYGSFGQFPGFGQQPYYPSSPYGQYGGYNPYAEEEDEDEDGDVYEEEDEDENEAVEIDEDEYYK